MNFKDYYNKPISLDNSNEKKINKMGINTGNHHHQTVGSLVGSGLGKKKPYMVAKYLTAKKHEHPKITLCLNKKDPRNGVALSHPEALDIIKKYNVCPTPQENSKSIKQTGVHLVLVSPKVYVLMYKGS